MLLFWAMQKSNQKTRENRILSTHNLPPARPVFDAIMLFVISKKGITLDMVQFQFFPRSLGLTQELDDVISCFNAIENQVTSFSKELSSNNVLEIVRPPLEEKGYTVETGKAKQQKIHIPVLFGNNNTIDKFFNADAISSDGRIVIEVEAGRAVVNNQFLKDIFQACMMVEVEYLCIAVRNSYKGNNDFKKVFAFLETMYVSGRIKLPLRGILLIGY